MSFVIADTSTVFTAPVQVDFAPAGSNPNAINATTAPVQIGGGTTTAVAGQAVGTVGSATASNTVSYTTLNAAAGTTQQVVVSGAGTKANIGTGAAKVQAIGGGTIIESAQSTADAGVTKVISLGDNTVAYNGVAVNTSATVSSVSIDPTTGAATTKAVSINQVSGGQGGPFAYYAHGGFGADSIEGSSLADFIRGGAGNDTINGFGGNDLIRGGTGSDSIFGGVGNDTLYYTADQFPALRGATDTDTFADFTSGTDKISFDRSVVAGTGNITGLGTNTITVSSSASGSSIRIVSGGTAINASDINFIG